MPLICGGGGGDGAAEKTPEEAKADDELRKMQKECETQETKVCATLRWAMFLQHCPASA